jgi:hypothetical protein
MHDDERANGKVEAAARGGGEGVPDHAYRSPVVVDMGEATRRADERDASITSGRRVKLRASSGLPPCIGRVERVEGRALLVQWPGDSGAYPYDVSEVEAVPTVASSTLVKIRAAATASGHSLDVERPCVACKRPCVVTLGLRALADEAIVSRFTDEEVERSVSGMLAIATSRVSAEAVADASPSTVIVSSARVVDRGAHGGHDRVRIWNRGALAGELVVSAGDGDVLVERLTGHKLRAELAEIAETLDDAIERFADVSCALSHTSRHATK